MFDFPSSPANGQTFIPTVGGPAYVWDGVAWKLSTAGLSGSVFIGDAPPANPQHGQLWWESDTGNTFIYYQDGNSGQWVQFNIQGSAPAPASGRNLVVNPTFFISQENGTSLVTTSGQFLADQWQLGTSGLGTCTGGSSFQNNKYYGNIYPNAAQASPAASSYLMMYQQLEGIMLYPLGWGQAHAVPAVLNFKARSNVSGTFSACLGDNAGLASFPFDFNLIGGEPLKEFTVAIPPPPMGTWNLLTSAASATLRLTHTVGSDYKAPVNKAWYAGTKLAGPGITNNAVAGINYLLATDVQLLPDPDSSGAAPDFVAPDYGEELRRCQRYYTKYGLYASSYVVFLDGNAPAAGTYTVTSLPYPNTMRAVPAAAATWGSAININGHNVEAATTHALVTLRATAVGRFFEQLTSLSLSARM